MKLIEMKLLLLSIFFISTNILLAQDIWSDNRRVYDFAAFGGSGFVILEGTNQDTIIDNLVYKKIIQTEINVSSNFEEIDTTFSFILIREEGDKVFLFDNFERTLFDFSKEQGDTLAFMNFIEDDTPILKSLGDTLIDGQLLRYQDILLDDVTNSWGEVIIRVIEGIGPINSYFLVERFYSAIPDGLFYHLKCFENDFISINSTNIYGLECDNLPIISTAKNVLIERKKVFPNPFMERFSIYDPRSELYKIYDIKGKEIKAIKAKHEDALEVDLTGEKGFEFILVGFNINGRIVSINKLIKNGG